MFLQKLCRFQQKFRNNHQFHSNIVNNITNLPKNASFDIEYLCNPENLLEIEDNITKRKGVGDIRLVNKLNQQLNNLDKSDSNYEIISKQFYDELMKIPNRTHPKVIEYGNDPIVVRDIGNLKEFNGEIYEFHEITKKLKLLRRDQLGNVCGSRSYYLLGQLAQLEQAIIRFVVTKLFENNFKLISVPDILPREIVERCGMNTRSTRNQVYTLDSTLHGPDLCLSGTSEIALAGFLMDKTLKESDLPLKLTAISRCYRAEVSNLAEERGIYRVHEFTKVEMFVVSKPEQSDGILEELLQIQQDLFEALGLSFRVLDMPPHELGAQAYRKYDIEAWLYGKRMFGEISSCSNCLDYQSRRLGIRYETNYINEFVHTLNGTACAIPRLLIALIELGQNRNGTVTIPEVLRRYMGGIEAIGKQKRIPELKLVKNKK